MNAFLYNLKEKILKKLSLMYICTLAKYVSESRASERIHKKNPKNFVILQTGNYTPFEEQKRNLFIKNKNLFTIKDD